MSAVGPLLSEEARLTCDAQRLLISSVLHLEAAGAAALPEAGADIADLIEDAGALADELVRVADRYGHAEVARRLRKKRCLA